MLIHSLIFFISTLQFSTQRSYANSELKSVSQTYSVFNVITNLTSEAIELFFSLDTDTFPTSITSMAISSAFYYTDLWLLQYFKVFHMLTMITYLGYLSPMILHFLKSLNSLELSVDLTENLYCLPPSLPTYHNTLLHLAQLKVIIMHTSKIVSLSLTGLKH